MSTMTKADLEAMIKDAIGPELAALRTEIVAAPRGFASGIQGDLKAPAKDPEKGIRAARCIRALACARGDHARAAQIAEKWGDPVVAKALSESVFEDGGAVVAPEFSEEIIDLLTARTTVRALGATPVPMNSGSLTLPYLHVGSTASYVGELQNIPTSQQQVRQMQLSVKKLAALTPLSNDLIRDAGPRADAMVRNDLVRSMSLREDLAFIRDDGTEGKPKGMRRQADAANVFPRTQVGGVNTLATAIADLGKACRRLEEQNVQMTSPGWLLSPRSKWHLMTLLDGSGNKVFWDEMQKGTLFTFPFRVTTQIPNNLGVAGDESEIYLAEFATLIIGENTQLLIDVFPGGAYHDGSSVVSGISSDQTVIRTIARHDFGARHNGKEIAVITDVDWAA